MNIIFRVQAADKVGAKAAVAAELAREMAEKPAHAADGSTIQMVAEAYIDLLKVDPARDIAVVVNATLLGDWADGAMVAINSANLTIGAGFVDRA